MFRSIVLVLASMLLVASMPLHAQRGPQHSGGSGKPPGNPSSSGDTEIRDFEREFAQFLDSAKDVLRFASLGTTEQGESGTQFRVDYLKPSGAIGFYHPDWVVE